MVFSLKKQLKHIYDFNLFESKQFILAAIFLSRFKLKWMPESYMEKCKELFLQELRNIYS